MHYTMHYTNSWAVSETKVCEVFTEVLKLNPEHSKSPSKDGDGLPIGQEGEMKGRRGVNQS